MYGFTIKIKMLVFAKVLPIAFIKESAFIKYLFIYLLQQTKLFNSGLNTSCFSHIFCRIKYHQTPILFMIVLFSKWPL